MVHHSDSLPSRTLEWVEEKFSKVQLDHKLEYTSRYMHPAQNMPDYGSDLAQVSHCWEVLISSCRCYTKVHYDFSTTTWLLQESVQWPDTLKPASISRLCLKQG